MLNRFFAYYESRSAGDRGVLATLILITLVFGILAIIKTSLFFAPETPAYGGSLTEGVIGAPRFINPLLAVTQTDKDLVSLIYAGLVRPNADGDLAPYIAESVDVSDDGRTYTITLHNDIFFSDGFPLTSEDVVYTINKIQDPLVAATTRANWDGVTTDILSSRELKISLATPYTPFMENLTFGILPAHIWNTVTSDQFSYSTYNTEPIGAGAYMISKIEKTKDGLPVSYTLAPNNYYHTKKPRLSKLIFNFYIDDEKRIASYYAGNIQSMSGVDAELLRTMDIDTKKSDIAHTELPRTFTLFFNQNKSTALRDDGARRALDALLDRNALTNELLGEYGSPLEYPIPEPFVSNEPINQNNTSDRKEEARKLLTASNWSENISADAVTWEKVIDGATTTLSFTIATIDTPIFNKTARNIKEQFAKIGIPVEINSYTRANITDNIIRTRDYEALLFGTANGRIIDLYPFWHSSRRIDPGINVALYTNIDADKLLQDLRAAQNPDDMQTIYTEFTRILHKDIPALFLFSPHFTYLLPQDLHYSLPKKITDQSDRFTLIHEWYSETDKIWSFLIPTNTISTK